MANSKALTIRDRVSSDDGSNPTVGTGKAIGSRYANIEIYLGNADNTWSVTPLLVDTNEVSYLEGESTTIDGANGQNQVYTLETNYTSDLNFRVDSSTGTSPEITIKAIRI